MQRVNELFNTDRKFEEFAEQHGYYARKKIAKYFNKKILDDKELDELNDLKKEISKTIENLQNNLEQLKKNQELYEQEENQKQYLRKLIRKFEKLNYIITNKNNIADYTATKEYKNGLEIRKLTSAYTVPESNFAKKILINTTHKDPLIDIYITQVISRKPGIISSNLPKDSIEKIKYLSKKNKHESDLILLNEAKKWVDEAIRLYKTHNNNPDDNNIILEIKNHRLLNEKFLKNVILYCKEKNYQLNFFPNLQENIITDTDASNFLALYKKNQNKLYSEAYAPNEINYTSDEDIRSLYKKSYGNKIKFYSDSYDNDQKNSGAYNDIFNAISHAKESVLINGWTLSTTEKFTYYDSDLGQSITETIPRLIARKLLAPNAPDIVLMIWENIAPGFEVNAGLRQEIEKEIRNLSNNNKDITETLSKLHIKLTATHLTYSDHAKMVVVDSKTLFMGGLDLTIDRGNPQIWHDCHAKIEGPVVQDALDLFTRRFKRKNNPSETTNYKGIEALEKVKRRCKDIIESDPINNQQDQHNPNAPSMQFLTSIRKEFLDDTNLQLTWMKGTHTDELLHSQVQAIKNAKNFIYMENQFFSGPRFKKENYDYEKIGYNLVILEIFNKIQESIANGKPFHFYCQLPHRPEGAEDDQVVKLILRKQWKTMKWLITKIQTEIDFHYPNDINRPQVGDYITFSNLGYYDGEKFQMKYTHSKLMIIDDEVAFLGSNNCNERSNKGNRDHEICMRIQYYDEIKKYRKDLMNQHFSKEIMELLQDLDPNDKSFYDTIKKYMNQNIDTDNIDNIYNLLNMNKIYSTPWGNIPTDDLEKGNKPDYVPNKTPEIVTGIGQLSTRIGSFFR